MLDHAFRSATRNFSTLFLFVALVTLPLHLAHAGIFRNVIEVAELHPQIERFSEEEMIRGVGRTELARYRAFGIALAAIEIALLPFFVRGAERIVETERRGGVPTVPNGVRGAIGREREPGERRSRPLGSILIAAAFALVLGFVLRQLGLTAVSLMSPPAAFLGVGAIEALSRAVAAPWLLVTAAGEPH